MRVFFLAVLTFISVLALGKSAETTEVQEDDQLVEFLYDEPADLQTLTKDISEILGKSFILDKGPSTKISIIPQGKVTKDLAYELYLTALRELGYTVAETSFISRVIPLKKAFYHMPFEENLGKALYGQQSLIYVLKLEHAQAKNILRFLTASLGAGSAIEISSDQILLSGAFSTVKGIVETVKYLDKEVEQDRALHLIPILNTSSKTIFSSLKDLGLVGKGSQFQSGFVVNEERSNTLYAFGSKDYYEQIRQFVALLDVKDQVAVGKKFYVRPLEFAEAKTVAGILNSLKPSKNENDGKKKKKKSNDKQPNNQEGLSLVEDFEVTADESQNVLIIQSSESQMKILSHLLKKLDKRRAQIFFEIEMIEVSDNFNFQFSPSSVLPVDIVKDKATIIQGWKAEKVLPVLTDPVSSDGKISSSELAEKMNVAGEDLILGVLAKDKFSINGLKGVSPGALIHLMKTDSANRVISSPFLMSMDGEASNLVISDTKSYQVRERSQGPTTQSGVAGSIVTSKMEKVSSEIIIDLTGSLDSSTALTLDLDLKVDSISGFTKDGLPNMAKKRVKQKVGLQNGQTVFISGFRTAYKFTTFNKIPLFGDIPIIGWLFRSNTEVEHEGRVYIFITPHISWGEEDLKGLYKKKFEERLGDIELLKKRNLL